MGGRTYGSYVLSFLRANGFQGEVQYVVDDAYKKKNDGCIPFSAYLESWADKSVMIFGFHNYRQVREKYEAYRGQIRYLYDFRVNCVQGKLLRWNRDEAVNRLSNYNRTYDMLADEFSRRTMELYLRAAVNGEFDELFDVCYQEPAYFNEVTGDYPADVLVDCGAFDGDDIYDFVKAFPQYQRIYALEPDEKNICRLKENMQQDGIENVFPINKGVYKETTTLHFSADHGEASHLSDTGEAAIPVLALDELLENCTDNIFIKMDIEGSEMDALTGAKEIISKKHPCLAICVYHKEDDLITIPEYIDSLVEKGTYDYFLRFHGQSISELVFYAVPQ